MTWFQWRRALHRARMTDAIDDPWVVAWLVNEYLYLKSRERR